MSIKADRSALKSEVTTKITDGASSISPQDVRDVNNAAADSLAHRLDVEVRVINMSTATPPGSPSDGDAYVVASGATDDWAGRTDEIAIWDNSVSPGEWVFSGAPADGQSVWNLADDKQYRWDAGVSPSAWAEVSTGSFTRGSAQATTSGTAFDFTGLPTGLSKIDILFSEVSLDGTDNILVQIGDGGGIESSGYVATGNVFSNGGAEAGSSSTSAFVIHMTGPGGVFSGRMVLERIDGDEWISSHIGKHSTSTVNLGGGSKTLSATLDRVRITRSGTDSFDAGSVNILHQ